MIASKHCAPVHNFFTKCEPLLQLSQRASYDLKKKKKKLDAMSLKREAQAQILNMFQT